MIHEETTPQTGVPRLLLETSEALAYLNAQAREDDVARLLTLAEEGRITLAMAQAGWNEISERPDDEGRRRLQHLRDYVGYRPDVARWDVGRWDFNVWGSEHSQAIDRDLPDRMSKKGKKAGNISDREQFVLFEAGAYDYLVVSDKAFTQQQTRTLVSEPLGLHERIGNATEALAYLAVQWGITVEEPAPRSPS